MTLAADGDPQSSPSSDGSGGRHHDTSDFTFDGIDIAGATPQHALDTLLAEVKQGSAPQAYRFVNAYSLALASRDASYKAVLTGRGTNLPDGRPLAALLTRFSGTRTCHQVRGPAFFESALDQGRDVGLKHFLLGTTTETLALLKTRLAERFPGVEIVGAHSPPFRELTEHDHREHDRLIASSDADIVWVGMGTPRQDFETRRIVDSTGVTAIGVGAAFDFSAGMKRQAPLVFRRLGLEWLFRMLCEPRRLTRRYVVGNSVFLRLAFRDWRSR